MIVTTTDSVEGRRIIYYKGIVVSEVFTSADKSNMDDARKTALRDLESHGADKGASGVVGVRISYQMLGDDQLMISASGTAVVLK